MRTVCLRGLNGLIVLWGIIACLLVSGGRDLLALPGDCDTECRNVPTVAKYDGTKNWCVQYEFPDCLFCIANGCNSNVAKSEGTCQEDKSTAQNVDVDLTCKMYCNTIMQNKYYEATTEKTKFKFTKLGTNVNKCMPKGDPL